MNDKKVYKVEIEEIAQRIISVVASSEQKAIEKVAARYENGEIKMNWDTCAAFSQVTIYKE